MVQYIGGTVQWCDLNTNTGSILGNDGNLYRIHDFTRIICRTIKAGSLVVGFISASSAHPILTEVRKVVPKIPGVMVSCDKG